MLSIFLVATEKKRIREGRKGKRSKKRRGEVDKRGEKNYQMVRFFELNSEGDTSVHGLVEIMRSVRCKNCIVVSDMKRKKEKEQEKRYRNIKT